MLLPPRSNSSPRRADNPNVCWELTMDDPGNITLKRGFTLRSAFSLAFADVSPIVALYTVFSLVVALAGVGFWWAFPIVLGGQLLVAAVFGDVASRWPLAGSVYQWSRHLIGPRYGWYTAWAYIW